MTKKTLDSAQLKLQKRGLLERVKALELSTSGLLTTLELCMLRNTLSSEEMKTINTCLNRLCSVLERTDSDLTISLTTWRDGIEKAREIIQSNMESKQGYQDTTKKNSGTQQENPSSVMFTETNQPVMGTVNIPIAGFFLPSRLQSHKNLNKKTDG